MNPFYKYLEFEYGSKTLKDLRLRLSNPLVLNDPFEFNPQIDLNEVTLEEASTFWKSDGGLEIIYKGKKITQPFAEFKKQFLHNGIEEYISGWMSDRSSVAKKIDYRKGLKSRFHIVCGSENPTSILMWSHYAKNHTGLVLGFDQNEFPFPEFHQTGNILPVNYIDDRPTYKHRLIADTDYQLSEFRRIASTKYTDWQYEREIRIIVPLGAKTIGRHIKQTEDGFYLVLSPKNICTVILGAMMDQNQKQEIQSVLKDKIFEHAVVKEASLDQGSFSLNIK